MENYPFLLVRFAAGEEPSQWDQGSALLGCVLGFFHKGCFMPEARHHPASAA